MLLMLVTYISVLQVKILLYKLQLVYLGPIKAQAHSQQRNV